MSDYRIERINENSFADIKTLYSKSFGIDVSEEKLRRKYDTISFGEAFVGFLAYHNELNEPAAYYGVFPLQFFHQGKTYLVAQSGDTMTAPNHQKKGLFIQLATKTYDLAKELGIEFVFGFPNENSLPGFQRKLNWQFFDTMYTFQLKVNTIPLLELASVKKQILPVYHWLTKAKLKKMESGFSKGFSDQVDSGIKHDELFYTYKMNSLVHFIEKNGFSLAIKTENHLYIGDVNPFENEKLPLFIETLHQLGKQFYSKKVVLNLSKNHWLYPLISQQISPQKSLPIGFLPLNQETCSAFDFSEIKFSQIDYDTF